MKVLHAGCGGDHLPAYFLDAIGEACEEIRLDIDARMKADIVASITDMGEIGTFDAVFSSHCLEHLYPHDVPVALAEFRRVTKPGGIAMVVVPDLEGLTVSDEVLYTTVQGLKVTAFDLFYGYRPCIKDNPFMAHHSGFTAKLLEGVMKDAGFKTVTVRRAGDYNLCAVGVS